MLRSELRPLGPQLCNPAIWISDGVPAGFNPSLYLAQVETPLGRPGQITGGIGDDAITSTNESIVAGRGCDKVIAGGVDDVLLGQQGHDVEMAWLSSALSGFFLTGCLCTSRLS